jgi:hypothetical protein
MRLAYGKTPQGNQMLLARRLIERGVRFVQVWHDGWDHHQDLQERITKKAKEIDQPVAALLADLKQRGLLDTTLVLWGGEFGRKPTKGPQRLREPGPRPRRPGLLGLARRRRRQGRDDLRRHGPVRRRGGDGQGARARPARHDPARPGIRPHQAHLPLQRARLPADGRGRERGPADPGLMKAQRQGRGRARGWPRSSRRRLRADIATALRPPRRRPARGDLPEDLQFFEAKIRPVLADRCYKCHSRDADKIKGGLMLDTREGMLHGGDTGPAIAPGKPEDSLIIDAISYRDATSRCRPRATGSRPAGRGHHRVDPPRRARPEVAGRQGKLLELRRRRPRPLVVPSREKQASRPCPTRPGARRPSTTSSWPGSRRTR